MFVSNLDAGSVDVPCEFVFLLESRDLTQPQISLPVSITGKTKIVGFLHLGDEAPAQESTQHLSALDQAPEAPPRWLLDSQAHGCGVCCRTC